MENKGSQTTWTADALQQAYRALAGREQEFRVVSNPEELEQLEREIRGHTDTLARLLLQKQVQASLETDAHKAKEAELIARWPGTMKNEGYETVHIRTATGVSIPIRARYYRCVDKRPPATRHKGVYAGLAVLGVHERCTPLLGAMVSSWSALLGSFEEVRQVLSEQGVELGVKVLRLITYRYAERARAMQQVEHFALGPGESVAGRRVVVSCDGGRIRLREYKRGRKTPKGRRRYRGAWREPKLLIIYVVDPEGRLDKTFPPVIDGCLQGPDALFRLIQAYLVTLKVHEAEKVLFVADGAHWIWKRTPGLVQTLGLNAEQVHELIDFYHAVEHLGKVAALRKSWTVKERQAWIRKHRRLLMRGKFEQVVKAVEGLCRGRHSKALTTEREYFAQNRHRMAYDRLKALQLPVGSGAVESAVRRVINLRMKGPCIFWGKENADNMLMLRAYYKAGRWEVLKRMANSPLSLLST